MSQFVLRPVEARDIDAIFEQMRDSESVRTAAFTPADPNDRSAFDAHMAKVMSSTENSFLAIICDSRLVGTIASYVSDGTLRVLQKAGFHPIGTEVSFAPGRAAEIEETILELS